MGLPITIRESLNVRDGGQYFVVAIPICTAYLCFTVGGASVATLSCSRRFFNARRKKLFVLYRVVTMWAKNERERYGAPKLTFETVTDLVRQIHVLPSVRTELSI